jgi:hypothetical protein
LYRDQYGALDALVEALQTDYVVYVSLNGSPDVVSENMLHTLLVCSARVPEAK